MKTISEHNQQATTYALGKNSRVMAGVLCDNCKTEMYYENVDVVLACIPPKQTVVCPSCNKVNYKIR